MDPPLRKRVFVRTPTQSKREAVPVLLVSDDTITSDLSAFYAAVQTQQSQLVSDVKPTGYAVHHIDGPVLTSPYFMMSGDHIIICTRNEDYSKNLGPVYLSFFQFQLQTVETLLSSTKLAGCARKPVLLESQQSINFFGQ